MVLSCDGDASTTIIGFRPRNVRFLAPLFRRLGLWGTLGSSPTALVPFVSCSMVLTNAEVRLKPVVKNAELKGRLQLLA